MFSPVLILQWPTTPGNMANYCVGLLSLPSGQMSNKIEWLKDAAKWKQISETANVRINWKVTPNFTSGPRLCHPLRTQIFSC